MCIRDRHKPRSLRFASSSTVRRQTGRGGGLAGKGKRGRLGLLVETGAGKGGAKGVVEGGGVKDGPEDAKAKVGPGGGEAKVDPGGCRP